MTDILQPETPPEETRRDAGFSLTELMIVVFIMGLLATVVLINVLPARDTAMVSKAKTVARKLLVLPDTRFRKKSSAP